MNQGRPAKADERLLLEQVAKAAGSYGYEGPDLDGRRLRVIVAIAEGVLVVTAVVLEAS